MPLKKVICPQCGSNELELFGRSAFKCESCGTILKEEPEPIKQEPVTAEPKKAPEKPFRSKRIMRGFGEDYDPEEIVPGDEGHHEAGNDFVKSLFWLGIIGVLALLAAWLILPE